MVTSSGNLFYGASDRSQPRKIRAFIAACLDRLRRIPLDTVNEAALITYQRFAEGKAPREDFSRACRAILEGMVSRQGTAMISYLAAGMWTDDPSGAGSAAADIACVLANEIAKESVAVTCADASEDDWVSWSFTGGPPDPLWQSTHQAELKYQALILRDVMGNPFRPGHIHAQCLRANDGAAERLACCIHQESAFDKLPLLADALEDGGCEDAAILSHCRGAGPHTRGCWVLDLILTPQ
jgi:hypothetical protein